MEAAKKGNALSIVFVATLLWIGACTDFTLPSSTEAAAARAAKSGDSSGSQSRVTEKPVADRAADFTLISLEGDQVTLSHIKKGKGAVLVFFATWCVNCVKEMKEIGEFSEIAGKENIIVLGIDYKQKKATVDRFIKSEGVKYKILLDADGKVTTEKFGIRGIPHIIGINAKDEIIYRGIALPEAKEEFIKKLKQGL
jgi:peroxiredoxin